MPPSPVFFEEKSHDTDNLKNIESILSHNGFTYQDLILLNLHDKKELVNKPNIIDLEKKLRDVGYGYIDIIRLNLLEKNSILVTL